MSTLLVVVLLGLLIGGVLGGLGGGGAVLAVPALVYLVGQPAQEATTSSLAIVGLSAVVAVVSHQKSGNVRWRVGLVFGLVGVPAAWLGSWANARVDGTVLLLGFSAVLLLAAAAMLTTKRPRTTDEIVEHEHEHERVSASAGPETASAGTEGGSVAGSPLLVGTAALAIGLLTGFFGVGGGFVIVPALVLALAMPMHQAIGTSLMIIAINSAASLASRVGASHFDWSVILPFTLAAMVATILGKSIAGRLSSTRLQKAFAVLLILVAGYTAWQSLADALSAA